MGCGILEFVKDHPFPQENVLEDISINYRGAGMGVKQVTLKAGQHVIQHKHLYAHLSILIYGSVTVTTDEWMKDLSGPASLVIQAGINHSVTVHSDALWLCVHATEDLENLIA